jgi:hypothetical protein
MIDVSVLSAGSVVWGVFIIALCLVILTGILKFKDK